jgi:hypothetical protein
MLDLNIRAASRSTIAILGQVCLGIVERHLGAPGGEAAAALFFGRLVAA